MLVKCAKTVASCFLLRWPTNRRIVRQLASVYQNNMKSSQARRFLFHWLGSRLSALAVIFLTVAPVAAAQAPFAFDPEMAAARYVLPDGTVPDLCLSGSGSSGKGAFGPHCPLCTLIKAFALAPCDGDFVARLRPDNAVAVSHSQPDMPRNVWRGIGQRAPPLAA